MRLAALPLEALDALVAGDLDAASAACGVPLTPWFLDERWLWQIRSAQLREQPADAHWIARAVLVDEVAIGHVGFHGAPDERGMVEVAYAVDPAHRRQGHATAMLGEALAWADGEPSVRVVRASISPDNVASERTLAPYGFVRVGEQWDQDDGLEILYERSTRRSS